MSDLPQLNEIPSPQARKELDALVAHLPSSERIPRRSGEITFGHPWQIRAFAMAIAMHKSGVFEWPEFQKRLITSIGEWECHDGDMTNWRYYDHWMEALEQIAMAKGIVADSELETRAGQILANPAANHHGAVREPVNVVAASATRGTQ
jgi:nitrile hydratase accessory protein